MRPKVQRRECSVQLATSQPITRADNIFPNCEKKQVSLHIKHHQLRAGNVSLCGYKHAMVQVIAAAISIDQPVVIENPPLVDDTFVYCSIIERAGGCAYIAEGKLHIDPRGMSGTKIPFDLSQKIHGSLYLMPSYAMRFGGFEFFGSGGCQIGGNQSRGKRPVGHILSVMEKFGIELMTSESKIAGRMQRASSPTCLDILEYSDNPLIMQGPLVGGATKAAIICGLHQRKVMIANPYLKTDVRDLLRFIEAAGFQVNQTPGLLEIIKTDNTARDAPIHFKLSPCISELITYVALAAHTGIELTLTGLDKKRVLLGMAPEFALFDRMGLPYRWEGNELHIDKFDRLQSIDIDVTPEGIQSDHHPFFALMLLKGTSVSRIREFV